MGERMGKVSEWGVRAAIRDIENKRSQKGGRRRIKLSSEFAAMLPQSNQIAPGSRGSHRASRAWHGKSKGWEKTKTEPWVPKKPLSEEFEALLPKKVQQSDGKK
jgi:hypothetical protein